LALQRGLRRGRTGSPKRLTSWLPGPNSAVIQTVTAATNTLVDTGISSLENQTIVRIRGTLTVWLEVVTTAGDGFTRFAAGIGIASLQAFDAGVASLPAPSSDAEWPGWLWFHEGSALIGSETTEVLRGPMSAVRIPIDSKAMRKFRQNEVLFGVVSTVVEVGAATMRFQLSSRILSKLA